jgi:hypothetical protein
VQAASNTFPYVVLSLVVLGAAWWALICYSCSALTGWRKLSRRFASDQEPVAPSRSAGPWFYSVYMRCWSHYSCIVRITVTQDALYLSVILPFRPAHPPLRIPWTEIKLGTAKFFWRSYVALTLGQQEKIPLRITEAMARKLGLLEDLSGEALSSVR